MAKFFKSFFMPEKKRSNKDDGDDDKNDFNPPLDGRRNLSISRSGRMKQNNKKRSSLTIDLYGERLQPVEKPKSREYHVNNPVTAGNPRRSSLESSDLDLNRKENSRNSPANEAVVSARKPIDGDTERKISAESVRTPEEEIEMAFEIIDKVL